MKGFVFDIQKFALHEGLEGDTERVQMLITPEKLKFIVINYVVEPGDFTNSVGNS